MDIIYLMIPLAVMLLTIIVAAFIWAVRSGQFDDLEGPANRILFEDDDERLVRRPSSDQRGGQSGGQNGSKSGDKADGA